MVGRESLRSGEIGDGEIGGDEIKDNKEDVEIADREKFFFNYTDRCAVSIYSANLIINRAAIEIANTY
jgi:hypothetical protein